MRGAVRRYVRLALWSVLLMACADEGDGASDSMGSMAAAGPAGAVQGPGANTGPGQAGAAGSMAPGLPGPTPSMSSMSTMPGSPSTPLPATTPTGGLPCDVDAVVTRHCQQCHGTTPLFGAPMTLATAADFHAPAVTDPSRQVHELVGERIHDAQKPMPPTAALPAPDLALLDAWLLAGAPGADSSGTACDDGNDGNDTAGELAPGSEGALDWAADCDSVHEIHAHASGDTGIGYHVTPGQNDAYICWYFDAPWGADEVQALEFRTAIDKAAVVHHWLLYGSDSLARPAGSVGACTGVNEATLLTGWAPGREDLVMPDEVGLEMPRGAGAGVVLQIHYYANGMDVLDQSGVDFCTTKRFRPNTASISWLGTVGINVAPGTTGMASGTCRPSANEPIHILRTWPHMHLLGTRMEAVVQRQGGAQETLIDMPFNFDSQTSYPTPVTLNAGDSIRTTCFYDNTTDQPATFGEGTGDEMCFAFVYAYPAGALSGGAVQRPNYCLGL